MDEKIPLDRHFLYIMHSGTATSAEDNLSILAEMPSGPFAFLPSSLFIIAAIILGYQKIPNLS